MRLYRKDELIARFIGANINENGNVMTESGAWAKPDYFTSWDRLMAAVYRIESKGFEVRIEGISCKINRILEKDNTIVQLVCGDLKQKKKLVYLAVTQFIEWYNVNKQ